MSSHKAFRRNFRKHLTKHVVGEKAREILKNIDADSPVIKLFQEYACEIDDKNDRYERIVKISRDITIESKRIIFLLHNTGTELEEKKETIFSEANIRLHQLLEKFKLIAIELQNRDHYLYLRSYTCGLEEYIEALCFYEYQRNATIPSFNDVSNKLSFVINSPTEDSPETTELKLCCPPIEILLGLGDFTGEMMRKCINNLGSGNIDDCYKACGFVRNIYMGFLGLSCAGQIGRKFYTLKQSLAKMELVCYNIKVRGSEVPKHMLAAVASSTPEENTDDEGFF